MSSKTDYVELIATLYACIFEINDSEKDDSKILDKLYSWLEEKKKSGYILRDVKKRKSIDEQAGNFKSIESYLDCIK